jgi:glutamate racemase
VSKTDDLFLLLIDYDLPAPKRNSTIQRTRTNAHTHTHVFDILYLSRCTHYRVLSMLISDVLIPNTVVSLPATRVERNSRVL